jgi:hypothetical protein
MGLWSIKVAFLKKSSPGLPLAGALVETSRKRAKSRSRIWKPHRTGPNSDVHGLTRRVLNLLIQPRRRDLNISAEAISKGWPRSSEGSEPTISPRQIRRWLNGENCPSDEDLWHVATTLSRLGRPWCDGLGILWACGRFARCVQLVGILLILDEIPMEYVDPLWQMLTHCKMLYTATSIDREHSLLLCEYLTKESPSLEAIETAASLLEKRWNDLMSSWSFDIADCTEREAVKAFWKPYKPLSKRMHDVFARSLKNTKPTNDLNTYLADLFDIAFAVANARDVAADTKREVVLNLLGQCFNSYELGVHEDAPRRIQSGADRSEVFDLSKLPKYRRFANKLVKALEEHERQY